MSLAIPESDRLVALRRDLHRHPEPAWCEFYTTARIVEEVRSIGVDELHVGADAIDPENRLSVPSEDALAEWFERAQTRDVDPDLLAAMEGGYTGAVAVLRRGEGPTIALRVDIDALLREESTDEDHNPTAEGFRAETPAMHACGHDAHATLGVGVLEAIAGDDDFQGTLKVFFQPAEERIGGGKAMATSGHLDDVDYLFAAHVGLDHPTGEIVAGIDDFLAVSHFRAEFSGEPAHAGAKPEAGRNAIQAMATAIQNLYAIPRHSEGMTRVNVGEVGGGSATNIIAEDAFVEGEVRGVSTELKDYMRERAERVLFSAAEMHDCEVELSTHGEAPSATSDQELVDVVFDVASADVDVDSTVERDALGGSEDATYLMQEVQSHGGLATYIGVGTNHPGGHHTSTFDVDERSLQPGVRVLAESIKRTAQVLP